MHYSFTLDYFPPQFYSPKNALGARTTRNRPGLAGPHSRQEGFHAQARNAETPFQWLADETVSRLVSRAAKQSPLDARFSQQMSLNGKVELLAQQWDLAGAGESIAHLRMVHLRGPRNEIVNTWVFPRQPQHMPVFAAALLAVRGSVRIAFVDIQTPAASRDVALEAELLTAALATRFVTLPCKVQAPVWATHASQGNFTYARNVSADQMHVVQDCYLAYLDTYLGAFASPGESDAVQSGEPSRRTAVALEKLHEYQLHHLRSSPGGRYLSKLFGANWAQSFLQSFLFAKP